MADMTLAEARGHATRMASALRAFVYAEEVLAKAGEAEALIAGGAKSLAKIRAEIVTESDRLAAVKSQAAADVSACKDSVAKAQADAKALLAGIETTLKDKRKEADQAIQAFDAAMAKASKEHTELLAVMTQEESDARATHAEAMKGLEALKARL